MSKSATGRWLLVLVLFWLIAFGASFGYAFFTFPADHVLPLFRLPWSFYTGFDLWIDFLPAVTAASMLLSFSFFFPSIASSNSGKISFFGRIFPGVMAWGIVFTLLYVIGAELILPPLTERREDIAYQSKRAGEWARQGDAAEALADFSEAYDAYKRALAIDLDNPLLVEDLERVEGQIPLAEQGASSSSLESKTGPTRQELEMQASDALMLAKKAYADEDYFTAHYWALLASRWDPEQKRTAMGIAGRSWEAIGKLSPDRLDEERFGRFAKKIAGYQALEQGDAIEAYQTFLELAGDPEAKSDPDIVEFLERSREAVADVSYSAELALQAEAMPGVPDLLFRDSSSGPFIAAGKMVSIEGKSFLLHLELLALDDDGKPIVHITAPAAQFHGKTLLLRGLDPNSGKIVDIPEELFAQRRLYRGTGWLLDLDRGLLALSSDQREIADFGSQSHGLGVSNAAALFRSSIRESRHGYFRFPGQLELLFRGSMPFLFLNMLIFSVGLGHFFRFRGEHIPIFGFFFVPFVPFLMKWAIDLFSYAMRLVTALLLFSVSFSLALAAMLVFHGIMLFVVLLFSAGQRDA
ncbi:hypothetical protein [Sediminispirochaeta bajacaliforniensis]|uniref:hypothetical protein n=1 Tax=Sediminispirochaeta bajacaliforniensis TaxID=148 RepID=UPI000381FFF6|nr:hypothetical protein [Sediminispirochaeta bajacaliforniensis]